MNTRSMRLMQNCTRALYVTSILAATVAALGLWVCGFVELGLGIGAYWGSEGAGAAQALAKTLKGLEVLFLAPVALLTVISVGRYLRAYTQGGEDLEIADRRVSDVKAFVGALMIAILATDLVDSILGDGLQYEHALTSALSIAVLLAFLMFLRWRHASRERQRS